MAIPIPIQELYCQSRIANTCMGNTKPLKKHRVEVWLLLLLSVLGAWTGTTTIRIDSRCLLVPVAEAFFFLFFFFRLTPQHQQPPPPFILPSHVKNGNYSVSFQWLYLLLPLQGWREKERQTLRLHVLRKAIGGRGMWIGRSVLAVSEGTSSARAPIGHWIKFNKRPTDVINKLTFEVDSHFGRAQGQAYHFLKKSIIELDCLNFGGNFGRQFDGACL